MATNQEGMSRRQTSLAQRVAQRVKDDIFNQRLLPREPLVEAELAEAYGVSKTPVREALLSLTRGGLVESDSFRGARVRDFTAEDVREIYEMRMLLEPFALEKAVPQMEDDDLAVLCSLLQEADAAVEAEDLLRLSAINRDFHRALVVRCGNSRIVETLDHLHDQLQVIALRLWFLKPTYVQEAQQHKAIATAVEAREASRAAELLGAHIIEFKDRYVRTFGESRPNEQRLGQIRR
jgi:DNA-binding GntR family transcriptional regulator